MDYKPSKYQFQCSNITFTYQNRYNRLFEKVANKRNESEINRIKIFQEAKALEISVGNSYCEYPLMYTFKDNSK